MQVDLGMSNNVSQLSSNQSVANKTINSNQRQENVSVVMWQNDTSDSPNGGQGASNQVILLIEALM